MTGFIVACAIFSLAAYFVYPWSESESTAQRLVGSVFIGGLIGLVLFGLSECGFGGGETTVTIPGR
jgi:RsiW-degrading membrane proteinase PrsW (M82 family)